MKIYQLARLNGFYHWTGTIEKDTLPEDNGDYYWTTSKEECLALTNTRIEGSR